MFMERIYGEESAEVFGDFPIIKTKRFILRNILDSDCYDLFYIFCNKEVMKYSGMSSVNSIEQVKRIIRKLNSFYLKKTTLMWAIEEKSSGKVIGDCGFINLNLSSKRGEIGYLLKKDHWKKGVMTEVITAILDYSFKQLELNRVQASVDERNVGSIKLLKDCGFKKEGALRDYVYDKEKKTYNNLILLSKLKSDTLI